MTERTRLIRASTDLFTVWGTRTADGRSITAEWGEPVGSVGADPGLVFDIYEPTFTATDDGMVVVPRTRLEYLTNALRAVVQDYCNEAFVIHHSREGGFHEERDWRTCISIQCVRMRAAIVKAEAEELPQD